MGVRQNIVALMEREGLSQCAFARKIGRSQAIVSCWISGKKSPSATTQKIIREKFDLSESDLTSDHVGLYSQLHGGLVASENVCPLLNKTTSGEPVCEQLVEVPFRVALAHPKSFCILIHDGALSNRYPNNSVLLIDPNMKPFNGCAVLIKTQDRQYCVRVYSRGASTIMLAPDSSNDGYEDIVIHSSDTSISIEGVVVWYQAYKDIR